MWCNLESSKAIKQRVRTILNIYLFFLQIKATLSSSTIRLIFFSFCRFICITYKHFLLRSSFVFRTSSYKNSIWNIPGSFLLLYISIDFCFDISHASGHAQFCPVLFFLVFLRFTPPHSFKFCGRCVFLAGPLLAGFSLSFAMFHLSIARAICLLCRHGEEWTYILVGC